MTLTSDILRRLEKQVEDILFGRLPSDNNAMFTNGTDTPKDWRQEDYDNLWKDEPALTIELTKEQYHVHEDDEERRMIE